MSERERKSRGSFGFQSAHLFFLVTSSVIFVFNISRKSSNGISLELIGGLPVI